METDSKECAPNPHKLNTTAHINKKSAFKAQHFVNKTKSMHIISC